METIIRKGKIYLFILVALGFVGAIRVDSTRTVKPEKDKRTERREHIREDAIERVMVSAERWFGVYELTGNNDHPMITKAMRLCGLAGNKGYPWCAAAQAEIFNTANIPAPMSARVVDWFVTNVVWKREYGEVPLQLNTRGMVGGLYYQNLGRYGHIVLIVAEDKNNYYTLEGNTNLAGSREGEGFYKKIRSKKSIAVLADYCLFGRFWFEGYEQVLKGYGL
jgi:hypothetical protein